MQALPRLGERAPNLGLVFAGVGVGVDLIEQLLVVGGIPALGHGVVATLVVLGLDDECLHLLDLGHHCLDVLGAHLVPFC